MADVFSTGITGLNVAQTALATIAQNVSNANTPGYARQVIGLTTQSPTRTGSGYVGNGVSISGINALVDPFLESALTAATGQSSNSSQISDLMDQLQSLVSDTGNGISASSANFQSAVGQVASNPSSIPARQLVVSNAQAVVDSLNSVATNLGSLKQSNTQSLGAYAGQVNSMLQQVAHLNDQIVKSEPKDSNGNIQAGHLANDLREQRQQLINQLAQYVSVSTVDAPEGTTVMVGGAALVISNKASSISTQQDGLDPTQLNIGIKTNSGTVILDPAVIGGKVGATLDFINNGINNSLSQLDHYASMFAQAVNDQQAKGMDFYGNPGSQLLSTVSPTATPNSTNAGTLSIGVAVSPYSTQASNYSVSFSASSGYIVTRELDGSVVYNSPSMPATFDGITMSALAGAPQDGDTFLIKPYANAASSLKLLTKDPKQLALAVPVATSASAANTSNATISRPQVVSGLPLNANLSASVTITFTAANTYTISGTGIPGSPLAGQAYVSGQAISYNGWQASISGNPKAGDSFSVSAAVSPIGDGGNANELGKVLQGKSFASGTQTMAELYAGIQSDIGNRTALAHTNKTSDASVLNIATSQRESFSGVNLDQEAADLSRWQQIYAANAQVMSVAQKLFESLMNQF